MKTAVVICPGRGTYNKGELGYLHRHFSAPGLLAEFDKVREREGQETLTRLDGAASFSIAKHTRGDNASGLIFAATVGDFLAIDRNEIEIVAVTGNSMGWYSALACAGALPLESGFALANMMGTLMQQALIGGQLIYPFVEDDWRSNADAREAVLTTIREIDARPEHTLAISINLGGMIVLAGNEEGLAAFERQAEPKQGRYPMRLPNHAAFHTALQAPVAEQGRAIFATDRFEQPDLPLIDGRGAIWWPYSTDVNKLWDYTLGAQVTEGYDFTSAIGTAAAEFAPDLFIITGPGTTLGGAVAQSLILANWRGMSNKADFRQRQENAPLLVSMGMLDQRPWVS